MNNKLSYFPRKKMFENVQELVATFFTKGNYFTQSEDVTKAVLSTEDLDDYRDFYLALFLLSLASHLDKLKDIVDKILIKIKTQRKSIQITSEHSIRGRLDIDKYIELNKIQKNRPKIYPSNIQMSTYQIPEYQLTLKVVSHFAFIVRTSIDILIRTGNRKTKIVKLLENRYKFLFNAELVLKRKFGVNVNKRETYGYLKKKVKYKYRNRQIVTSEFNDLMDIYEIITSLKSINMDKHLELEMLQFNEDFDDRLFEIWTMKQISMAIANKAKGLLEYEPLYKARQEGIPVASIKTNKYIYEIMFQNRKDLLPRNSIKWYYIDDGKKKKLDAIPDIVVVVRDKDNQKDIVKSLLVDSKNRTWTFDRDMGKIKPEITHLIFVRDNFKEFFRNGFKAVLVAHNEEEYKDKVFKDEDDIQAEIKIVSLKLTEEGIKEDFHVRFNDIIKYLDL